MKAVVFHAVGDIRVEDVREPQIQQPADAVVCMTSSVPSALVSQVEDIEDAVEAYRCFDQRQSGWLKVELASAA